MTPNNYIQRPPKFISFVIVFILSFMLISIQSAQYLQVANLTSTQTQHAITWVEGVMKSGDAKIHVELPDATQLTENDPKVIELSLIVFEMQETKIYITKKITQPEKGNNTFSMIMDMGMKSLHCYLLITYNQAGTIGTIYNNATYNIYTDFPQAFSPPDQKIATITPQWFLTFGSIPQQRNNNNNNINSDESNQLQQNEEQSPSFTLTPRSPILSQLQASTYGSSISSRISAIPKRIDRISLYSLNGQFLPNLHHSHPNLTQFQKYELFIHGPGWLHSVRYSNPYNTKPYGNPFSFDMNFAQELSPCTLNSHRGTIYGDSLIFETTTLKQPDSYDKIYDQNLLGTQYLFLQCLSGVFWTYKNLQKDEFISQLPIFITIKPYINWYKPTTEYGVISIKLTMPQLIQLTTSSTTTLPHQLSTSTQSLTSSDLIATIMNSYSYIYNTTIQYRPKSEPYSTIGTITITYDLIFPTDNHLIDEYNKDGYDQINFSITSDKVFITPPSNIQGHLTLIPVPLDSNNIDNQSDYISSKDITTLNSVFYSPFTFQSSTQSTTIKIPLKTFFTTFNRTNYNYTNDILHLKAFVVINVDCDENYPISLQTSYTPQILMNYYHATSQSNNDLSLRTYPFPILPKIQQHQQFIKFDIYTHSNQYLYHSLINNNGYIIHQWNITLHSGHYLTGVKENGTLFINNDLNSPHYIGKLCSLRCRYLNTPEDASEQCKFPTEPVFKYNVNANTIIISNFTHHESTPIPIFVFRCHSHKTQYSQYPKLISPTAAIMDDNNDQNNNSNNDNTFDTHLQSTHSFLYTFIETPKNPHNVTFSNSIQFQHNSNVLPYSLLNQSPRIEPLGIDDGSGPEHDSNANDDDGGHDDDGHKDDDHDDDGNDDENTDGGKKGKKSHLLLIITVITIVVIVVAVVATLIIKYFVQNKPTTSTTTQFKSTRSKKFSINNDGDELHSVLSVDYENDNGFDDFDDDDDTIKSGLLTKTTTITTHRKGHTTSVDKKRS